MGKIVKIPFINMVLLEVRSFDISNQENRVYSTLDDICDIQKRILDLKDFLHNLYENTKCKHCK